MSPEEEPSETVVVPSGGDEAEEEKDGDSSARCFIDPVFDEILTTEDIQYGSAFNAATGQEQALLLDAYLPPASDLRDKRPAVVFMHGGGFSAGNKRMGAKLAKALAERGYAVFSIAYRLTKDAYPDASTQG